MRLPMVRGIRELELHINNTQSDGSERRQALDGVKDSFHSLHILIRNLWFSLSDEIVLWEKLLQWVAFTVSSRPFIYFWV